MTTIQTATGTADTAALGFTLMHEHLFIKSPGVFEQWPHLWDREAEIARAAALLERIHALGVSTIVDLTTIDLGRDAATMRAVAERSAVNVVVATGVWRDPPRYFQRNNPEPIAAIFVRDIEQGIGDTGGRAGVIKLATDSVVDAQNEVLLRAGARAHRRTGVPISTHHSVADRAGLAQQDVFQSEGVDLSRVVIGHSGDSDDLDYLTAILKRGSYIGMDRFGIDPVLPAEQRNATVAALCAKGWAKQMVLSHDASSFSESMAEAVRVERMPNWHMAYISEQVIPDLLRRGVSQADIDTMTVDNPRRIFETQGAY
jgi:phosphotriesterase-related protein